MSKLFSPIKMRGMELHNRVVVSPMCEYSAVDGNAQDWHLMHLGQFSVSGIGLIITEAAAVEARGRITHQCLGIWNDDNEAALSRVVNFCRQHGQAKLGTQLAHAGRKASTHRPWEGRNSLAPDEGAWETVGPSGNPHADGWHTPKGMSEEDLATVKQAFVDAVERADRIGFDMIEAHGAHGYLLHEFLSPIANTRDDEYGGSLDNRMRYPLEVFAAMREKWPEEKPMGLRVSSTDWVEGGWNADEAVEFARRLKDLGCDYICASSGGVSEEQKIVLGEGYQVQFAEKIKREAEIATMAVGMIYDPHHAESLVAEGKADTVALARGLLFDPHWPLRAATVLGAETPAPPQYQRAYGFRFLREKEIEWSRPSPVDTAAE